MGKLNQKALEAAQDVFDRHPRSATRLGAAITAYLASLQQPGGWVLVPANHASAVASGLLVCGMCGARNWERIDTGQLVRCVNCKIVTSDVTFAPATPPHSGSSHD